MACCFGTNEKQKKGKQPTEMKRGKVFLSLGP